MSGKAEASPNPDLSVAIGDVTLKNPIIAASGTFGYGLEMAEFCPPGALGAVIVKGLSLEPWPGNPGHRIVETAGGLLNSIGLQNMGVKAFIAEPLKNLKRAKATVGANVIGRNKGEYVKVAKILADSEVDFLELNISCPNLSSKGGLSFGSDPDQAARLTFAVATAVNGAKPIWVKLPPLVADIAKLAKNVESSGADALSLINTVPGMAVNLETLRPELGHVTGGLSGAPIKPLALRQVYLTAGAVEIPVIGVGGVFSGADALEHMAVGAQAVQMGTAILKDPRSPLAAIEEIQAWLIRKQIRKIADIAFSLEVNG